MIRLTTLCENTAGVSGLAAEWGWSILVETDDKRILVDTGRSDIAVQNASRMGVELGSIDAIVLSHSHADHTGGLREVLARTSKVDLIGHPALWIERYKRDPETGSLIYNGIPFVRSEVSKNANLKLSAAAQRLSATMMTTGEVEQQTSFETIESRYVFKEEEQIKADDFADDQALVCTTAKGMVLVLGCAHRGLINTILQARKITGQSIIHTIIGGTHLYPKSIEQIEQTIRELKLLEVQNIGVSHCTGFEASRRLAGAFGNRFFVNNSGNILEID